VACRLSVMVGVVRISGVGCYRSGQGQILRDDVAVSQSLT
jgi:hypothetical protein